MQYYIDLLNKTLMYMVQALPFVMLIFFIVLASVIGVALANKFADSTLDGQQRRRRFKKLGDDSDRHEIIHKIRTLHPREFEFYVANILDQNGYKTKVVGKYGKGDGGVDIIARRDGIHYIVQCKKFIDRDVGVKHLREFYGVGADLVYTKDVRLIFVNTTYFTSTAKKYAKQHNIKLVDADYLVELVFGIENRGGSVELNEDRGELMRQTPPQCPVCHRLLAWRKGQYGDFVGCTGYPSCRYTFSVDKDHDLLK